MSEPPHDRDADPFDLGREPGRPLGREDFTRERFAVFVRVMRKAGVLKDEFDFEAHTASRRRFLDALDPRGDLWVFGYGSLMWNPVIRYAERRPAVVKGYARRFCLDSPVGRGTPERPGLMCGLDLGDACHGVVYRLTPALRETEVEILWYREMVSGAYRPGFVAAETPEGPVEAMTFIVNRDFERYVPADALDHEAAARRIAHAQGNIGTNREYLYNTVAHLDEMGIEDEPIHALCRRVRKLRGEA